MLDIKDFNFSQNQSQFDFRGFFHRFIANWKWIIATLIILLLVAYNINLRQQKIYGLESSIVIKDENNSFFTSNTSLVFNWGGVSDKVETIITTLKSRSHNEEVVSKLQYYIKYLEKDNYYYKDVYGETPFYVTIQKEKPQLLSKLIQIDFINETSYKLTIDFEDNTTTKVQNYLNFLKDEVKVSSGKFSKTYKIDQQINLPFLNFSLHLHPSAINYKGKTFFVKFDNFDDVVSKYKEINISTDNKALSVIRLKLDGTNKNRIVEYLNTTVEVLKTNQLKNKNLFATNTISFIDSTLAAMEGMVKKSENELKDFSQGKNVLELENGGSNISNQLSTYDIQKDQINRKIAYYNLLKSYLDKSTDFSKLPAPTVAGIEDPNIMQNVSKLIELSVKRDEMAYTIKNDKMYADFDSQMNAVKKILQENVRNSKNALGLELSMVSSNINTLEGQAKVLPQQKQEYLKIMREYDLRGSIYNTFLQKRSDALIYKASNVSDIEFIDSAKDVGSGLIGPKNDITYIIAILLGILIPFIVIFILTVLDNKINTTEEVKKLTNIPLIGVVGRKNTETNLSVFEKPKSPLAESFRAIRSSLQYLYKQQKTDGTKIVMLTSSISGEGKTFCSINLATVFALSQKKTIIVGLDLRKPRIFGDFNIDNSTGVVNYLIEKNSLQEIIKNTHIAYLDVISSGPIPPNPSELLMSEKMKTLIEELKEIYDYIILDTPPVGLVSDALELSQFADATLYVVKQSYTEKGMLSLVNEKHKRGELHNISILLNGYQNKSKYGYDFGAYGYGNYGDAYLEVETKKKSIINKVIKRK